MRRRSRSAPALLALGAAIATGGCGGVGATASRTSAPPPVAEQVRAALDSGLQEQAPLGAMGMHPARPRLPRAHVTSCSGPPSGGAGRYRCTLRPIGSGARRLDPLVVVVDRKGTWSAGLHLGGAYVGLWGGGLRLP